MRGILWFLLGALVVTVVLVVFAFVLFLAAFLFATSEQMFSTGNGWSWLVAFGGLFLVVLDLGGLGFILRGVLFDW